MQKILSLNCSKGYASNGMLFKFSNAWKNSLFLNYLNQNIPARCYITIVEPRWKRSHVKRNTDILSLDPNLSWPEACFKAAMYSKGTTRHMGLLKFKLIKIKEDLKFGYLVPQTTFQVLNSCMRLTATTGRCGNFHRSQKFYDTELTRDPNKILHVDVFAWKKKKKRTESWDNMKSANPLQNRVTIF